LNKITQFLFIFLIPILVACSEPKTPQSKDIQGTIVKLKALNQLLYPVNASFNSSFQFPFDDMYLMQRNQFYIDFAQSDSYELFSKKELDYLMIQQRFPERYFPWPAKIDVLDKVLFNAIIEQKESVILKAATWVKFVKQRLQEATLSKIKLNKMAHADLLTRINRVNDKLNELVTKDNVKFRSLKKELNALQAYVFEYKPRNMLGLRQMPNGVDWYQSKLNYFLEKVKAPDEWLILVQRELTTLNMSTLALVNRDVEDLLLKKLIDDGFSISEPLLSVLASTFTGDLLKSKVSGLDWQQGYINFNKTFDNLYKNTNKIDNNFKVIWLTMAEIDLGIHYQGWSLKQASHVLKQRIALNDAEAVSLIEYVVFNPGQIMSGTRALLMSQ